MRSVDSGAAAMGQSILPKEWMRNWGGKEGGSIGDIKASGLRREKKEDS